MKKISIIILLMLSLIGFYKINFENYKKHIEIKQNFINHPEYLPTKETAQKTAFWFKNLRADLYWLQTVQYIWSNAISSDYKKYLYTIIDLVTELNPYFEHPYIIWSLLLPDYNHRYEDLTIEEQNKYTNQWEELMIKWINNFCNSEKIELIKNEFDLKKIWTSEEYRNPCKTYEVPYYLAYLYYFYKNDPIKASTYYKIASANSDSPDWTKIMAAIMQWKWWDREKSFFMLLNLANFIDPENQVCSEFATQLEQIWIWIFMQKNIELDHNLIKTLEDTRKDVFWDYITDDEDKILSNTNCNNYINKALRELNLQYIEKADEKYKTDNDWYSSANAKELYDEWYIKFLPTDFQQYEDHWIIYEYNNDTQNYDYTMWNY